MNKGPGAEPRNDKYNLMYLTGQNSELHLLRSPTTRGTLVMLVGVEYYYTLSQINCYLMDLQNSVLLVCRSNDNFSYAQKGMESEEKHS